MNPKDIVYEYLVNGYNKAQEERAKSEESKLGVLRGGSLVAMTEDGSFIGDPRTALVRLMGLDVASDYDKQLMFDGGLFNEDAILQYFTKSGIHYECEEDIPVVVTTPNNNTITGRPDALLYKDGKPDILLEFKGIFGGTSALKYHHAGKATPKDHNILQCAFYARYHNVPAVLIYTCRSWVPQNITPNKQKELVDPNHRSFYYNSKNYISNIKPYQSLYDVDWDDDTITLEGKRTAITWQDIMRGMDYVAELAHSQTPPPYFINEVDVWGNKIWNNNMFYPYKNVNHDDWDSFIEGLKGLR